MTESTVCLEGNHTCVSPAAVGPSLPLTMCNVGEKATILRISGKEETKKFLVGLGFVVGSTVSIVNRAGNDLILDVKGSKIAINGSMAMKIVVNPE